MNTRIFGIIFGLIIAITNSTSSASTAVQQNHVMGVCKVIPNAATVKPSMENSIGPVDEAFSYLHRYMSVTNLEYEDINSLASITILENPSHGSIKVLNYQYAKEILSDPGSAEIYDGAKGYVYLPEKNYFGEDRFAVVVDVKGYGQFKIIYFLHAADIGGTGSDEGIPGDPCKVDGGAFREWRISLTESSFLTANQSIIRYA